MVTLVSTGSPDSGLLTVNSQVRMYVPTHLFTYLETHTHNHFTALWTLSGTTRVSRYQKVHFAMFWIFWCKMIMQVDTQTIWMDCHPILTMVAHVHII